MQARQPPPGGGPQQPPAGGPSGGPGRGRGEQPGAQGPAGQPASGPGQEPPGRPVDRGGGGQPVDQGHRAGQSGPVGQERGPGQGVGQGQPTAQGPGTAQDQPVAQGRPDQLGARAPGAEPTPSRVEGGGLGPIEVTELLQTDVVTAERDTPVATVVAEMAEKDVGSVVIVEGEEPVGIVTDRSIALALETTPDVTEHEVDGLLGEEFVTGDTEMSAVDVLERLSEGGIRRLPIVDEDGELAGIVTMDDLLVLLSEELSDVADVVRTQSPRH